MHPFMEEYLKNPRANKIAFIKAIRYALDCDLVVAKKAADKLWAVSKESLKTDLEKYAAKSPSIYEIESEFAIVLKRHYGEQFDHYKITSTGNFKFVVVEFVILVSVMFFDGSYYATYVLVEY